MVVFYKQNERLNSGHPLLFLLLLRMTRGAPSDAISCQQLARLCRRQWFARLFVHWPLVQVARLSRNEGILSAKKTRVFVMIVSVGNCSCNCLAAMCSILCFQDSWPSWRRWLSNATGTAATKRKPRRGRNNSLGELWRSGRPERAPIGYVAAGRWRRTPVNGCFSFSGKSSPPHPNAFAQLIALGLAALNSLSRSQLSLRIQLQTDRQGRMQSVAAGYPLDFCSLTHFSAALEDDVNEEEEESSFDQRPQFLRCSFAIFSYVFVPVCLFTLSLFFVRMFSTPTIRQPSLFTHRHSVVSSIARLVARPRAATFVPNPDKCAVVCFIALSRSC